MLHIYVHRDDPLPSAGYQAASPLEAAKPLNSTARPLSPSVGQREGGPIQLANYVVEAPASPGRIVLVLGDSDQLSEQLMLRLSQNHGGEKPHLYALQLVEAEIAEVTSPETVEPSELGQAAGQPVTPTQRCGLISMRAE